MAIVSRAPRCPRCGGTAGLEEIQRWPFACAKCISQNASKIDAAWRRSVAFWEQLEREREPKRQQDTAARERWNQSIRDGLKRLGL